MTKIAVVALGGNALTRAGQSGSYDEMVANAAAMATAVNDVLEAGCAGTADVTSCCRARLPTCGRRPRPRCPRSRSRCSAR